MTDNGEAPEGKTPFEEHPLYQTAMKRLAQGDVADAAVKFDRLTELYPDEQQLQDQAVRVQLMAAMGDGKEIPAERGQPAPLLRTVLVLLLAVAILTAGAAGFAWAYDEWVRAPKAIAEREAQINLALQDGLTCLNAGDAQCALDRCQAVLTQVPAHPTAQACIEQAQQEKDLNDLCIQAQAADQQGETQTALDLYHQIRGKRENFCNATARIQALETKQALETLWQGAQGAAQDGNWQDAISQLLQIRKQDIDFRRSEVAGLLFQAYTELARLQIVQANGDLAILDQALFYLNEALALRPTDQALLRERDLASGFVSGFKARARGDWAGAVAAWEPVYEAQPDYQGGILRTPLQEAYPKAAEQLIAQAYGNIAALRQASDYLTKALANQPEDQTLSEERRLVDEYVAGSDAAAQEQWNEAIAHWGPIFAAYPDYQQGALETRLRQVCTDNPDASSGLCPP